MTYPITGIAAIVLLASAGAASAQPADRAAALEEKGLYRQAEPLRRQALAAFRGDETEAAAEALDLLAGNLAMQSRTGEAEPLYRRALELRMALRGVAVARLARSLNQLAQIVADSGDFTEAEKLSRRALDLYMEIGQRNSLDRAATLSNLGGILASAGRLSEANLSYEQALSILTRIGPSAEMQRSIALNNLGTNLYRIALDRRVPVVYRRDLRMRNVIQAEIFQVADSRETSPPPARTVVLQQSDTALREALAIRERLLGTDHPDTANTANSLAVTLAALGDREQAERLYTRALATKLRYLLPGDRDTITGYWGLGSVSPPAKARTLYRQAARGIAVAQARYRDFDRSASRELRSYAPVFVAQVRVNWVLSGTAAAD